MVISAHTHRFCVTLPEMKNSVCVNNITSNDPVKYDNTHHQCHVNLPITITYLSSTVILLHYDNYKSLSCVFYSLFIGSRLSTQLLSLMSSGWDDFFSSETLTSLQLLFSEFGHSKFSSRKFFWQTSQLSSRGNEERPHFSISEIHITYSLN